MFNQVLIILFWVVFIYCSFSVLYLFMFATAAKLFKRNKSAATFLPLKKIAVLVPAYKEDEIILATAQNILNQDYPTQLFDVYIIADSFKYSTIEQLEKLRVNVLQVAFTNSSKTKSLNECFKNIHRYYDV